MLIKEIQEIDAEELEISELEDIYSNCIRDHRRPISKACPDGLYRVRQISKNEVIRSFGQIWYRDWKNVNPSEYVYNRCSTKGQNFFYASNTLDAAIIEVKPSDNDLLLIGDFGIRPGHKLNCHYAGIETLKRNNLINEPDSLGLKSTRDDEIEVFLNKLFTVKPSSNQGHEYKHSIAVSNLLLKNQSTDCVIYPSIAAKEKFINFGIKADSVNNKMYCKSIYAYRFNEKNKGYILTPVYYGDKNELNQCNSKSTNVELIPIPENQIEQIEYSL